MMPEETPNQADELLKRYAKERREQAGEFSLHPATRRLLQDEVTRTFRKAGGVKQKGWFTWLGTWNGRLAFGTAAAAVVITGFFIAWNAKQDRRAMELAQASFPVRDAWATRGLDRALAEKEVAAADTVALSDVAGSAPRAEIEARVALKKELADAKQTTLLAGGVTTTGALDKFYSYGLIATNFADHLSMSLARGGEIPATATQALSAGYFDVANLRHDSTAGVALAFGTTTFSAQEKSLSSAVANAPAGAPGSVLKSGELEKLKAAPAIAASGVEPSGAASRARAMRPNAAAAPAATPPPTIALGAARPAEVMTRAETELGAQYRFAANQTQAPADRYGRLQRQAAPVLTSFTIEQTGQTVRIVDADGSVYDGTVELPPRTELDFDADARRADKDALVREKLAEAKTDTAPRHQEITFRAAGSNVTLRQIVVVSGRLASVTNAGASAAFGGVAGRATAEATRAKTVNELRTDTPTLRAGVAGERGFAGRYGFTTNASATIEGTVRIGATNQQWFRAVRQP
jgi:hypothetical protein